MFDITQEYFESCCPSFISGDEDTFNSITEFFNEAECFLVDEFGTSVIEELVNNYQTNDADENVLSDNKYREGQHLLSLHGFCKSFICATAASLAIAHLDLILTPNGFGVVSNGNISPASRERVKALNESCTATRTYLIKKIHAGLLGNKTTASLYIGSEKYNQKVYSIFTEADREDILKINRALYPDNTDVKRIERDIIERLTEIISEPLYLDILEEVRKTEVNEKFRYFIDESMFLLADKDSLVYGRCLNRLNGLVASSPQLVESYTNSDLYVSRNTANYANSKHDTCYFF